MEQTGIQLTIDGVLTAVFLFFALTKASSGLYQNLTKAAATVISAVLALIVSLLFTNVVTALIFPWAKAQLLDHMELGAIQSTREADIASQLQRLLPDGMSHMTQKLGLDVSEFVSQAIQDAGSRIHPEQIAMNALTALLEPVVRTLVRAGLFLITFLVLRFMLGILKNLLEPLIELPVIRWVDLLGGALMGIVECAVLLWAICWCADLVQIPAFEALAEKSKILTLLVRIG